MTGFEALKRVCKNSGRTSYAIAKAIDRSPSFISQTLRQASKPTADTLALIAGACGYRLALIPKSEELPPDAIEIDART